MRALSAEGVLSMDPDLILAQQGSGPPDALAILKAAIPMVEVTDRPQPDGVAEKIRQIGAAVGRTAEPRRSPGRSLTGSTLWPATSPPFRASAGGYCSCSRCPAGA